MSKIVPKLNLNKTPQLVDNNSLVMAKNIRLLEDGTIGPDTSLEEIETNTGDATEISIEHPAVIETVTDFFYSILDYKGIIEVLIGRDPDLANSCFDFYNNDHDNPWDDKYKLSNLRFYREVSANNSSLIYCYKYSPSQIKWISDKFKYDINNNFLINGNGYLFLIAIRLEIVSNNPVPADDKPDFFYTILPKKELNNTIVFDGVDYKVFNPVYQTKLTHQETIQDAWTEYLNTYDTIEYIAQIVGLDNKIYFFKESNYIKDSTAARDAIAIEYPNEVFVGTTPGSGQIVTFDVNFEGYITRNGILFQDSSIAATLFPNINDRIKIFEYDEVENTFKIVKCAWKYSGGKINGCVFRNNTGKSILTICEYDFDDETTNIPIKHINLSDCRETDDESIYTQNPNIPITNLILAGEYSSVIPSGVYQFFIRYKINDYFYTSWFPCSKECFAGTKKKVSTIQGELKYIDKHTDSDNSFIFNVEHLYPQFNSIYKKFQIGFILSKDDNAIVAREWKEFNFDVESIYFDYFADDLKDVNIDDMLETTYELFNVENCVNYKNKLYISNYSETDFNPNLKNLAKDIRVKINVHDIGTQISGDFFDNEKLISTNDDGNFDYIGTETYNNHIKNKWAKSPYFLLSHISEASDARGYFNSIPLEESEHHHVENSNVLPTDDSLAHRYSTEDGTIYEGWLNSKHLSQYINNYNKACVLSIYIKVNNQWIDVLDADYRSTHNVAWQDNYIIRTNNNESSVINGCDTVLRNNIAYYNKTENKWYINSYSDNQYYPISEYYVVYSVLTNTRKEHKVISNIRPTHGHNNYYTPEFDFVYTRKTIYILKRTLVFDSSFITSYASDKKLYPTLMPFTKYNFYVHYVKANGVITNGYLINSNPIYIDRYCKKEKLGTVTGNTVVIGGVTHNINEFHEIDIVANESFTDINVTDDLFIHNNNDGTVSYYKRGDPINFREEDNIILYPSFSNIEKPNGYVGCFITAAKVGNNVCQLFNVEHKTLSNGDILYKADCLELDTMIYTKFNNLCIYNSSGQEITNEGKYFDSGNTEDINYFGEPGSVTWITDEVAQTDSNDHDIFWLVIKTNETIKRLIKYTPYIPFDTNNVSYNSYIDITNLGFVCFVKKLIKSTITSNTGIYVSGTDVYEITRNENSESNATLVLQETNDENNFMLLRSNDEIRIKSNFNLEYISLSTDITPRPKTLHPTDEESVTRLVNLVDSLTSSYIYEFNSWYKEYTRKHYEVYTDEKQTRFDNTIRSSRIINDEEYNTFKFDATDYYNVPTLRGIIKNLISVANTIYVHCEHSLFKFTDNKTIDAQDEQVVLQENDIFNSGISEVFDAQYGYAGLKNREQSLITYNSYVFYDAVAKIIYAFGGEQQIGNISEPIKKLIKAIEPTDVQFVGDELHNRFFVNLINESGNVCLSFNFGSKSFIAVHDITFKSGFHTRRHTYFVHDNMYNGDKIGWSIYRITDTIDGNFIAYQNCYEPSLIQIADCDNVLLNPVKSVNACVDVIINTEYEKIKQLDYISWICSEILEYGNDENLVAEEVLNRKYPGTKLRIYSDSTQSDLFELLKSDGNAKISNEERNVNGNYEPSPNPNSWQYTQYNCGVWSMNYFRDILNTGDIFHYKASKNKITGGSGHSETTNLTPKTQRENLTQENSLIYGKYFVLRFIFNNKNFKLENVMLKMNDYGKTK